MKQQTAMGWLIDNMPIRFKNALLNECASEIEQAKQMEKEQIVGAYLEGDRNGFTRYKSNNVEQRTSEQYYNETYKS